MTDNTDNVEIIIDKIKADITKACENYLGEKTAEVKENEMFVTIEKPLFYGILNINLKDDINDKS